MENILPQVEPSCMCTKLIIGTVLIAYIIKLYVGNTSNFSSESDTNTSHQEDDNSQEPDWDKMDIKEYTQEFIARLS